MGIWPLSKLLAARQARGRALRSASTTARLRLEHLEERQMLSMDGLPVIDDFDRPDSTIISAAWLELAGDFAVADQQLAADLVGISLAMVDGTNAADVGLSARVDLTDLDNAQAGLVARYSQADGTMYVGTLVRANSAVTAEIWRGREGIWSVLAAGSTTAVSGTLRFTAEGDQLRLFLDGALLLEVIDAAPLDAGGVGLRASGGALYDDLRIESRRTTEISHTIEDDRSVQLTWLPLPEQAAYHTVVTDSSTGETHFSGWVYGTSLRLDLPSGTYKARVAASGMPYAVYTLSVVFSVEAFDHEVLDSGEVKLFWTPVEGASAYHLIVKNSDTQVEAHRDWVGSASIALALEPGNYSAWVAPSGAAYAVHSFSVVPPLAPQSLESVDYTYIAPGKATIFWDDVFGVSIYFVSIRDSDGVDVFRDWVSGTELTVDLQPDNYVVSVSVSGVDPVTTAMSLADFSQSTFTPLSPIGPTDRQQNHFTWFPVTGAVAYYFQLRALDGPVIESHWVHGGTETVANAAPGEYQWRVIPLNERNEQASNTGWVSLSISDVPLVRENILGIEPDVPVPPHLVHLNVPQTAIRALDGTIYIADTLSNVVRRSRDGQVEIFAGTLEAGYNGDGYRTDVTLNQPTELIFDGEGNLLVVDTGNYLIRKIDVDTGQVTTLMGLPRQVVMPTDGQAAVDSPIGLTTALSFDSQGNLYIPTYVVLEDGGIDNRLFFISPDGVVHESAVALPAQVRDIRVESGVIDVIYESHFQRIYEDGTRRTAVLPSPFGGGIVFRADTQTTLIGNHGEVYEFDADFNRTVFSNGYANVADINVTSDGFLVVDGDRGVIVELDHEGREIPGRSIGSTSTQGTGTIVDVARYDDDTLLYLDNKKGYVYSYSISTGRTTVFVGNGQLEPARLGVDSSQTGFWFPNALAVDSQQNIYISENHRIIKIDTAGRTSLFAGDEASGDVATEVGGSAVSAADARFQSIRDIAFDAGDTMYVADAFNNKIKTISPEGVVTTIAGSGTAGIGTLGVDQFDIPAIEANLNRPLAVLPLADGTVLVSNGWSSTLERIEADGMLRRVAGIELTANYQGGGIYRGDGGPAREAYLNTPAGLAVSGDGVIYFADAFNHVIRSIDSAGIITTVWGQATPGYVSEGYLLNYPSSIALVGDDLYFTDNGNGLVSRVNLNLARSSFIDQANDYRKQSVTPLFPLQDTEAGAIIFQFDRNPLDHVYFFQVYTATGQIVWQDYIDTNWHQMDLVPGDYRWRVTAAALINGEFIFAEASEWVDFSATATVIRVWSDEAERYTLTRSVTPIAPLENVPAGAVEFRFDRDPLDYTYYLQLYRDSGEKVWQGYVYTNSWQTELAPGDYRWRVTPLAKIDEKFILAAPNDWVEFSVSLTRSITPITPLANVLPGVVEFRFDGDPLDYAYYLQLYRASGEKEWQGYVYTNSWQTELAAGGYRWRVTPLAKIDGTSVFAPPNDWVEFSVESESMSFKTVLDSLVGINLTRQHLPGEEFSYEIVSAPRQGTLLGGVTDALRTYRPNDGFVGDDGFTYRVRNEVGQSVLVTVQLNVRQPDRPSRSYFVPGFGTIGVAEGTPAPPVFTGARLPTELVVSSGLGNVIEKFGTDGQLQWRYHKSATWPGVAVHDGQVIFNDFKSIFFLDLETGALKRELKFDTTIEFVSPQEDGLLIGLRGEEKQTIVLWTEQQGVVWTNPHDVLFPRWADMRGDLIVVADTFNHRFYGVDRNTGEMTFSVEAFFPNDVRFTADNEILFVEEHADRVWKYNIETGNRTWVFGAGNGMENLELSVAEIRAISNELRIDPDDPRSMSKSSKTYSGPVTLYSPNGAVQLPDGSYYIADTDNHRVVHVSADGQLLAELEGFNNPNKIAFVP